VSATLGEADALCRRLLRGHYENFWVSSPLLPRTLRPHLARLYAFCRVTDDLGDESGASAGERLLAWREDLERCFRPGGEPEHPVLLALADTVRTHQLPEPPFFDLVAANLQDQWLTEYASWEQLLGYCRLSAAPVGRLVLALFGATSPRLERLSDDVCTGLQIANHAQDVGLDRSKGRTYVPRRDIDSLGLAGAVESMCDRALALLDSGRELEAAVPPRLGVQLALYRMGGEAIVAAIRRVDYRTDRHRPSVSNLFKLRLLPRALLQAGWRRTDGRRYREA
jgi:squalene synthase HpnC